MLISGHDSHAGNFLFYLAVFPMGLLPNTQNCGLRMRLECRERFPRHRLQRKRLVSDHGMYHGTCVTHVPWCMSVSLTRGGEGNVPGIPGACATRNFTIWQEAYGIPWWHVCVWNALLCLMSHLLPWMLLLTVRQVYALTYVLHT